jgi:hypothetical protein
MKIPVGDFSAKVEEEDTFSSQQSGMGSHNEST